MSEPRDVTLLLTALSGGDRSVLDRLMPAVYEQLRSLARRELRREGQGHTLNTTALVHEAYLRLARAERLTGECGVLVQFPRNPAHRRSMCD